MNADRQREWPLLPGLSWSVSCSSSSPLSFCSDSCSSAVISSLLGLALIAGVILNRAGQQQRQRQRQQRPQPINTRAREPQPPISRPRPPISASSSSTSLPYGPDMPTRRNPSSRRHPVYQASPAHYRNTSSTCLLSTSRESIRKASSLLAWELVIPIQGMNYRDWDYVNIRLHSLVHLGRVRGKTGAGGSSTASATPSTMGGSEDREERRLFCATVRDGYVLCM